jgi:hypothetical protein
MQEHAMSAGEQVRRHRTAHDAETNETKIAHVDVLTMSVTVNLPVAKVRFFPTHPQGRGNFSLRFYWPSCGLIRDGGTRKRHPLTGMQILLKFEGIDPHNIERHHLRTPTRWGGEFTDWPLA